MNFLRTEEDARYFVASRCDEAALERLEQFVERLEHANQQQNLVSSASFDSVWLRHIADSAQLLDLVPREGSPWVDLGSGAGLPGLVLAIIQDGRTFILVESRALRIQWLRETIAALNVYNCEVLGLDVKSVPQFDAGVISARAFAPLDRLVAQSARFSTTTTHWVLPKGRSAAKELAALPVDLRAMFHVKQSMTDPEAGIVVGVGKVEVTK